MFSSRYYLDDFIPPLSLFILTWGRLILSLGVILIGVEGAAILTNVSVFVFYTTTTLQNSFWHSLWCFFPLLLLLGKCWWSRSSRLPRNEGLSSALSHKYLHSVYIRVDLYTLAEMIIYTVFLSFQGDQGIRGDKVKETELPCWFNGNFY